MAEDKPTAPAETAPAPTFTLVGQYIRDLSFENPGAPGSMLQGGAGGPANLNISVGVKKQADEIYAVEITMTARAEREKTVLFNVELVYGGVFRISGFPQEHMLPVLFIECPRLLFPFARQIIADATRNGGFPPLMIDPIDFAQMFAQRVSEEQSRAQSQSAPN